MWLVRMLYRLMEGDGVALDEMVQAYYSIYGWFWRRLLAEEAADD